MSEALLSPVRLIFFHTLPKPTKKKLLVKIMGEIYEGKKWTSEKEISGYSKWRFFLVTVVKQLIVSASPREHRKMEFLLP